jgi:DNA-binding GntR family transcriptional regulator
MVTRAEEAYHALRDVIVRQEFPPGTWLRRRTLASKFKMSPTPLVQAFQRLEQEGLVECVPQWGVRVRALTVSELDQIYRMRLALETIVFRELACKVSQVASDLKKLRSLADQIDQSVDIAHGRPKPGAPIRQDHEFHLALARLAGMDLVVREIERLCLLSATMIPILPNPASTVPNHGQLLDAILTGDADIAERSIRAVLEPDMQYVIGFLREWFGDKPIIFGNDSEEGNQRP